MKKVLNFIGSTVGTLILIAFGLVVLKFIIPLLATFVLIFLQIMTIGAETELVYSHEFKIEAMQDNHTYVIHRRSGDSELRYCFMRYRNGELISGSTKANRSSIIENGENKVEVYYEKPVKFQKVHDFISKWSSFDGDENHAYWKHYKYYVPKGSVKTEFNIDLE